LATDTHTTGLAHHFDDVEQQREAVGLGMWVFLITEIMFFGGLFAGYAIYRSAYPAAFIEGSRHLDMTLGGINTAVLICSSLTMALAVHSAQTGKRLGLVLFLVLTIILGSAFLGVKAVEYADKFEHHTVPVPGLFHLEHPYDETVEPSRVQLFFGFYFTMTGLHALHMIIGIGVLAVLAFQAWRGRFSPEYNAPVDMTGLYWHFVDIVWIFLFPLLYLLGRHL
jgi:cytochrome c oxidase subunit III